MKKRPLLLVSASTLAILLYTWIGASALADSHAPIGADKTGYLNLYKRSYMYDLQKGSQYADLGLNHKALPHFQRAVERNPSNVIGQYSLAYVLLQLAEETPDGKLKADRLARAEWALLRTRDLNPDLTLTYYKLGKLALQRGDYQAAKEYYQSGVMANPENFALLFNLASVYEKLNEPEKAEKAYVEVIRINPRFVYAHNNLGLLLEQSNRQEDAEVVYREALRQVPEYNYARLNLGSLMQNQGRLDEAKALYAEAVKFEPNNGWAHLYLGNTHYRLGNYAEAVDAYKKAAKLNPEYPATYYLMSLALQKLDRDEEALESGQQYINLAPNGAFSREAGEIIMTIQQTKKRAVNSQKP